MNETTTTYDHRADFESRGARLLWVPRCSCGWEGVERGVVGDGGTRDYDARVEASRAAFDHWVMEHTAHECVVDLVLERLGEKLPKGIDFEPGDTGGGGYAINVPLADGGYVMITDYDGPLTGAEFYGEDTFSGWFVGRYDADASVHHDGDEEDHYVYASPVDDEDYNGPHADFEEMVAAVVNEVEAVREQEKLVTTLDSTFGNQREAFREDPGGWIDYHGIEATDENARVAIALVLKRWES